MHRSPVFFFFFFFNDTATTEIYTLSLHDALPICHAGHSMLDLPPDVDGPVVRGVPDRVDDQVPYGPADRKSTRLNSSHQIISYAVFCLKKKKKLHVYQNSQRWSRHTYTANSLIPA